MGSPSRVDFGSPILTEHGVVAEPLHNNPEREEAVVNFYKIRDFYRAHQIDKTTPALVARDRRSNNHGAVMKLEMPICSATIFVIDVPDPTQPQFYFEHDKMEDEFRSVMIESSGQTQHLSPAEVDFLLALMQRNCEISPFTAG